MLENTLDNGKREPTRHILAGCVILVAHQRQCSLSRDHPDFFPSEVSNFTVHVFGVLVHCWPALAVLFFINRQFTSGGNYCLCVPIR